MLPFGKDKTKTIGIDCGAQTLKVVTLKRSKDRVKLVSFGTTENKDPREVKSFLSKMKIHGGRIGVTSESHKVKTKMIELPKMPDEELRNAIEWQVKDIIEGKEEDYIIRYLKFDEAANIDTKKSPYLVFTLKKNELNERVNLIKSFGFSPNFIEPEVAALRFSFAYSLSRESDARHAFLEIGDTHSFFGIFNKENLLFFRSLNEISGAALTKSIMRDLNVSLEKALECKLNYKNGVAEEDLDTEAKKLKSTIANFLTKISLEIQRSIDAYAMMRTENRQPQSIFISGGGTYLTGFKEYLQTTLGFQVERFHPFSRLDTSAFDKETLGEEEEKYAIAVGLALQ